MKKLDKNVNFYVLVVRSFLTVILLASLIIAVVVPTQYYDEAIIKYLIIGALSFFMVLAIIFNVIIPFYTYKLYGYNINDEEVVIQKGVVFKKTIVIQIKRIQHVEKLQGPIQMLFKQASVVIYTAGSVEVVMGLNINQAEVELNELNQKLNLYLKIEEELKDE